MEGIIMTTQLLLSLSLLVLVHEWGHFIAARIFKIRVEKFYLFFDFLFPFSRVLNFSLFKIKRGDTLYGLGWFPLGGYVKIAGMIDESLDKEQAAAPPQPWEYRSKKPWQRIIVMLGGIIVNITVGVLIFIMLSFFLGDTYISKDYINTHGGVYAGELAQQLGIKTGDQITHINGRDFDKFSDVYNPDILLSRGSYYTIKRGQEKIRIDLPSNIIEMFDREGRFSEYMGPRTPAIVDQVMDNSMASRIGLQKGDVFIHMNGQEVNYIDEIDQAKQTSTDSISFQIRRGEQILTFHEPFFDKKYIGFQSSFIITPPDQLIQVNYSFTESFQKGSVDAWNIVALQIKAFGRIFSGDISLRKSLTGPIGLAQIYGGTWNWIRFWRLTGLISMVLAFMNLLPIPGLDGGYVVFLLYEMIVGKEINEKVFDVTLKVGLTILFLLMIFIFYNDIMRLFS